ncbi:hypothetical protein [Terrabacter sp. MAHUQ-38]|uniref:hypothetical protein n=1 Tax=unclassified Terrabacter TaxID=2630222 RepID=UPI00165D451B|nr:hypothetical protein [Terrabacter sp. MAHUQ-38]MBC9822869.1 hypothetical protein [Terrabacter sp. MAHUQ-38]
MRLPDDDELYEVDQTYLGPPGRYIAPMRHKAIFAWLGIAPLAFVIARRVGMEFSLLSVGLLLIATVWVAMVLADHATPERPISAIAASFWNDLRAPRADRRVRGASGAAFGRVRRPKGVLGRYVARRPTGNSED